MSCHLGLQPIADVHHNRGILPAATPVSKDVQCGKLTTCVLLSCTADKLWFISLIAVVYLPPTIQYLQVLVVLGFCWQQMNV